MCFDARHPRVDRHTRSCLRHKIRKAPRKGPSTNWDSSTWFWSAVMRLLLSRRCVRPCPTSVIKDSNCTEPISPAAHPARLRPGPVCTRNAVKVVAGLALKSVTGCATRKVLSGCKEESLPSFQVLDAGIYSYTSDGFVTVLPSGRHRLIPQAPGVGWTANDPPSGVGESENPPPSRAIGTAGAYIPASDYLLEGPLHQALHGPLVHSRRTKLHPPRGQALPDIEQARGPTPQSRTKHQSAAPPTSM